MAHGSAPAGALNQTELRPLLLHALTAVDASEAHNAWREWCRRADMERLSWESLQIIPALGGQLWEWLHDDPVAGIVRGIVRRAWTESQMRLHAARWDIDAAEAAGCGGA